MKNNRLRVSILFIAASCLWARGQAAEGASASAAILNKDRWAVSLEGGTLGLGATAWFTLNESFTFTAGFNGYSYSETVNSSGVNYDGDLKLSNVPVLANWHPFKGKFRVTAGLVFAGNKVDVVGVPGAGTTYNINGTTYTGAQVGRLAGTGKFANGTAPYIGVGISKGPQTKGWGGFADLGLMFTDSPNVTLTASGPISTDPTFRANLAAEVRKVNEDLEVADFYPVLRGGVMYRF